MTDEIPIQDQIKANQKAVIEKQIQINTAQGELNVLQTAQNALYLQQQLESLGE